MFFWGNEALAQKEDKVRHDKSSATHHKHGHKMHKPKGDEQVLLTTISTRNVLYGNKCVHDFTQSLGFEYHVETKMEKEMSTAWSRYWGNKAAKLKVTMKNGPFWQRRVRRKVNECRVKTGDHLW